ncbi:DUF433 domain-containing protein [Spirosoma sp. BT702]|uniref:DUF433 domain-containing protein n=1 Tax=Spirosoma profusum TaxID=2771354 RepID=A0A926XVL2_9BACT|nr:DUF433 domain-containing protein [Spirosoma profusum]MBD2701317.1 DUF433 domain-containing protein [Spirosoma profusum]
MLPDVITISPKVMGGTPVFKETRVPIQSLFDHLELGITVDDFLDDFPTVSKEQVLAVLKIAERLLTAPNLNSVYEAAA